jgi:hypothetical protein
VQPLDQGIIAAFEVYNRHELVGWILEEANKPGNLGKSLKDLTLLEIMRVHAWRSWFGSQYDACVGWIV